MGEFMKYAIAQCGAQQILVEEDKRMLVDLLDCEVGSVVEMPVMLLSSGSEVQVGTPMVDGARVMATIVEHVKGPKIRVFKYKAKTRYRRRKGHRQSYTRIKIDDILGGSESGSDASLAGIGLSKRIVSALETGGITTTKQVIAVLTKEGDKALLDLPGFGKKALENVKVALEAAGHNLE